MSTNNFWTHFLETKHSVDANLQIFSRYHHIGSHVHSPPSLLLSPKKLAVGLACGDQRRLTGNGSALEVVLHDYALYKSTFTLLYLLYFDANLQIFSRYHHIGSHVHSPPSLLLSPKKLSQSFP